MRALLLATSALLLPFAAHAQTAAAPPATTDVPRTAAGVPTGKLPDVATPSAYRLNLTIVPSEKRFQGHSEIDVTLKEARTMLYMHGRNLHITKATATVGGETFPVAFEQITPLGLGKLSFGRKVPAGRVTLKFDYDAPFRDQASGLYHVKVDGQWYSWTQFESIDARDAFPSFDEPGYKTPFTVSVTTSPGLTAVSNAPETGTTKDGDLVTHHFEATKPLPTYLVAFAVGPFATVKTSAAPTPERAEPMPVRIVGTQPNKDEMQFAADNTGPIVGLLEKYFGEPFPFPKLDQIGSPIMGGAMENAGADIYGDGILFLGDSPTTSQKQVFGMVVSHELSHQWFGDLVTPKWWDDIWLNESFANWMGYRIGNEWRPDLNIGTGAINEAFEAMQIDALKPGRPIHQKITSDKDINGAFDQITYGKGGQVVSMIAAYMGDKEFQKGVRLHLRRHAYGNASTEDFFKSLADAAGDPRVLASLKSFVDQQGVPVVSIRDENGKLIATQHRYSYLGANLTPQKWVIPLCIRRDTTRTCTLMDKDSMPVSAPGNGIIMPNAGGTGYYRFDLQPAEWTKLIAAAPTLPGGEALATTDSLWADFFAGKGTAEQLVALTRSMVNNPDSTAAVDNANRLADLANRGIIPETALPAYRKLIDTLYEPLLAKLGFDPAKVPDPKEDPDRQKLRAAVVRLLAGPGRDAAIREKLKTATQAYLAGDTTAISDQYLGLGIQQVVADADLATAKKMASEALSTDDDEVRSAMLGALASSGNADIANWLLNNFHDDRLRTPERVGMVFGMVHSPETREIAYKYVTDNFDSFATNGGIFAVLRLPALFAGACTAEQADTLDKVMRPKVAAAGVGMLGFDRTVDAIRVCSRVKAARSGEMGAALQAAAK